MKIIFKSRVDNASVVVKKGDTLTTQPDEKGRPQLLFIFEKRDQIRIVINPFKIKRYRKRYKWVENFRASDVKEKANDRAKSPDS